jgi:Tfp pilus assembly protein PilZ
MNSKNRLMPRIAINMKLTIQYSGGFECLSLNNLSGGGVFIRLSLSNLSGDGVFIKTNNPLPVDYTLAIQATLPGDSEILDIEGRVVWIKINSPDAGMGIEFTKISTQHQEKINSFVESCLREAQKDHASKTGTDAAALLVKNKE